MFRITSVLIVSILLVGYNDGAAPDHDTTVAFVDASTSDTTSLAGPPGAAPSQICSTDTPAPWFGGPSYYQSWSNGPSPDPNFFPIAVWLQSASNAQAYKQLGINLYIGQWQGVTQQALDDLSSVGMRLITSQNNVGLANLANAMLWGWMQPDEPDNAQPNGSGGYDPCVDPIEIQDFYNQMKMADGSRPVYLNLGRGVAVTDWIGRGTCTGMTAMYPEYAKGADILSFDVYPVTYNDIAGQLEYVGIGVANLRGWAHYQKPVWNWIETTHINSTVRPTAEQIISEVWISLIHGSAGIGYFVHEWQPAFTEAGLLLYDDAVQAVTQVNTQIQNLAPVLNSPPIDNALLLASSNIAVPVATVLKRYQGDTYIFTAAMADGATTATFDVTCVAEGAQVEVIGEGRDLTIQGGRFSDNFSAYQVHLYRIHSVDDDNDGMTDVFENTYGLDPLDPRDAAEDPDNDGLDNLAEFNAGTDPSNPDSDGDGIADGLDSDPAAASNVCDGLGNDVTLQNTIVTNATTLTCGASSSISVEPTVDVQSGGTLELISPNVNFVPGFSLSNGGMMEVISADPSKTGGP